MDFLILLSYLVSRIKNIMTPSEILYRLAVEKLGEDFTDDKVVPDEVSCAFALSLLLHSLTSKIPTIYSTKVLLDYFLAHPELFQPIQTPEKGALIVSATGTNTRPDIIPNGHCGVYLGEVRIASNDSATGLWKQNFDTASWTRRYVDRGGYKVHLFRKIA